MASDASSPTARVSVATAVMTNIKAAVSNVSSTSDCSGGPLGTVDPSPATTPKSTRSVAAAAIGAGQLPTDVRRRLTPGKVAAYCESQRYGGVEMRARQVTGRGDHHDDDKAKCQRHADVA